MSCFLFHEFGAFTPRHSSHHFSLDIVYPSTAPVNFAPGMSSSISSIISPSFPLVIASLLAIIVFIWSDVLTNRHFKDYPRRSLTANYTIPLLLWFLPVFCFPNENEQHVNVTILTAKTPWRRPPEVT